MLYQAKKRPGRDRSTTEGGDRIVEVTTTHHLRNYVSVHTSTWHIGTLPIRYRESPIPARESLNSGAVERNVTFNS